MAGKGSTRRQEDFRKVQEQWPLTKRPLKAYHKRIPASSRRSSS